MRKKGEGAKRCVRGRSDETKSKEEEKKDEEKEKNKSNERGCVSSTEGSVRREEFEEEK